MQVVKIRRRSGKQAKALGKGGCRACVRKVRSRATWSLISERKFEHSSKIQLSMHVKFVHLFIRGRVTCVCAGCAIAVQA